MFNSWLDGCPNGPRLRNPLIYQGDCQIMFPLAASEGQSRGLPSLKHAASFGVVVDRCVGAVPGIFVGAGFGPSCGSKPPKCGGSLDDSRALERSNSKTRCFSEVPAGYLSCTSSLWNSIVAVLALGTFEVCTRADLCDSSRHLEAGHGDTTNYQPVLGDVCVCLGVSSRGVVEHRAKRHGLRGFGPTLHNYFTQCRPKTNRLPGPGNGVGFERAHPGPTAPRHRTL
jgi:hypothetical protein